MIQTSNIGTCTPQEQAATGTTINVPYPTTRNTRSDDILFICIKTSGGGLIGTPTGFTDLFKHSGTADTLNPSVYLGWKKGVGNESGTLACTIQNFAAMGAMIAVPDVDLVSTIDVAGIFKDASTAASSFQQNSITTLVNNALVLSIAGENSTGHNLSIDSGFTEVYDRGTGTAVMELAYLLKTVAGAIAPTITLSTGTGKSIGYTVSIRPAPPRAGLLM